MNFMENSYFLVKISSITWGGVDGINILTLILSPNPIDSNTENEISIALPKKRREYFQSTFILVSDNSILYKEARIMHVVI